jgi:hypothetical protein
MLILICFSISSVILALVYALSGTRHGTARVCGLAVVCLVISVGCISPVLMLQCFLTLVFGLVCLAVRAKPRIVASSIGAAVVGYGFGFWTGYEEFREHDELREQHPFESVSSRLDYETKSQQESRSSSVPLHPEIELRLSDFENRHSFRNRRMMLAMLHDRTRDHFTTAYGFGKVRMIRVRKERIELPETDLIPLPSPPYQPEYDSGDEHSIPVANETVDPQPQPTKLELLSLHASGLEDFLDPDRMGYIKDREQVAGFTSHAFQSIPEIDPNESDVQWQVTRLELVSLLKHDVPMVYVSEHLPQMDELEDASTRPLDNFEAKALQQLRRSEDLVVQSDVNRIRLLGSLRAGKDCLECHSVQRGDLLGAFSYDLFRVRPKPMPKKSKPVKPHA